jgi:hypothetical protein
MAPLDSFSSLKLALESFIYNAFSKTQQEYILDNFEKLFQEFEAETKYSELFKREFQKINTFVIEYMAQFGNNSNQ